MRDQGSSLQQKDQKKQEVTNDTNPVDLTSQEMPPKTVSELQFGQNQIGNIIVDINESASLLNELGNLSDIIPETLREVEEKLNLHKELKIYVSFTPDRALLQTGVGGYAHSSSEAYIYLNPENENYHKNLEVELAATLYHELHHCKRWEDPGYGRTLREALVTEGLAQHFEADVRGVDNPPFYAVALTDEELRKTYELMKSELDLGQYDHYSWFVEGEKIGVPRYAGYSIGYEVVKRFLLESGKSAAELVAEPVSSFFK